ncbi:uncharacterized protein F54H12.2-like [Pecten maximus]|uniref:uncharacterized protein F54H12.2-like n=1 Tax=Pecten maximus TaxID=6579 RepID=UPI0014582A16|nr:uncharacterized protein F54H12.2-like [Pecten maximus]
MEEGLPKELMLFSLPPTQTGVEKMYYVDCRPVSQVTGNGPIEFHISGQTRDYISLSKSALYVKARIVKQDGTDLASAEKTALINLPLQSMWSQVDVSLQGKQLSVNSGNYAYKAYLQTLLNFSRSTQRTQLTSKLFFYDTPVAMNETDPAGTNSGLYERYQFTKDSLAFDMIGPLCEDVCRLDSLYILNGVDIDLKQYRNRLPFVLMSGAINKQYQIELQVVFPVCRVQVNPGVLVGHNKALEVSPAKYPYVRTEVKVATVPSGQSNFIWDNLHQSKLPSKIIVGLVSGDAYSGRFDKNPFNFQHFNAVSVGLYINNASVPYRPHKMDFNTNTGQCFITAFRSLYEVADKADRDTDNAIDRDDWPLGYALYGFLFQPQFGDEPHMSLTQQANVRLEIVLARSLSETVSCVVYSEFNDMFQIDQARNVIVSSAM